MSIEEEKAAASESSAQISSAIEKIMANPELISMVASAVGASGMGEKAESGEADGREKESSEKELNFPELAENLAPVLSLLGASSGKGGISAGKDRRSCLLAAMKPYLSPQRCEAIDYMIKFSRLSEVFRGFGG